MLNLKVFSLHLPHFCYELQKSESIRKKIELNLKKELKDVDVLNVRLDLKTIHPSWFQVA